MPRNMFINTLFDLILEFYWFIDVIDSRQPRHWRDLHLGNQLSWEPRRLCL